jgi:hypothetical protein
MPSFRTIFDIYVAKEREEREREDKKRVGGIGNMLSSAMKPNIKKLVRHGIPSELRATVRVPLLAFS